MRVDELAKRASLTMDSGGTRELVRCQLISQNQKELPPNILCIYLQQFC